MTISSDSASRRAPWSRVDDGIVRGVISRRLRPCEVCAALGCVVIVETYTLPENTSWRATTLNLGPSHVPVYLGLSCGCLQKLHRQVAHMTHG